MKKFVSLEKRSKHINNAVREELSDQVVVAKFATNLHRKAQFFAVCGLGFFLYIE